MKKFGKALVVGSMLFCAASAAQAARIEKITMGYDGVSEANDRSGKARMSDDGKWLVFRSDASNLVPGDTNGATDVFVSGRTERSLVRVSVSSEGAEGNGYSNHPQISADGRFVVFESNATTLTSEPDSNGSDDVYLHDRDADENGIFDEPGCISTVLLSKGMDGAAANNTSGTAWSDEQSISNDGRYVVFESNATNLLPDPVLVLVNGYLYDRLTGELSLMETAYGEDNIRDAFISGNGQYVVYRGSNSSHQTAGLYVFDRDADGNGAFDEGGGVATQVVYEGANWFGIWEYGPISDDGRYVAFRSDDPALVPGDTNGFSDVFVRDMQTGVVVRGNVGSDGSQSEGGDYVSTQSISSDGRFVLFSSNATDLVPDVLIPVDEWGVAIAQSYVHDRDADGNGIFDEPGGIVTELLSVNAQGGAADAYGARQHISADGRFVAIRSYAKNLDPNFPPEVANGMAHIYLIDRHAPAGDIDGDGFFEPEDCNDSNAAINPGASEILGNAMDENCNGMADDTPAVPLTITGAEYEIGGIEWEVQGDDATPGSTITIHVGVNLAGPVLGTVVADAAGEWQYEVEAGPISADPSLTISVISSDLKGTFAVPLRTN